MKRAKILIIDDEESIRNTFTDFLEKEGYLPWPVADYAGAMKALEGSAFDLVFTDIVLGPRSGIDILKEIKTRGHHCPVIMMTGLPDIDTAATSVRLNAFDYIPKPIKRDTLIRVTKQALQHKALLDEKRIVEAENEQYRLHLEAIFRSVEDAIVTVDTDRRVTRVNESFERICGLGTHEVLGNSYDSVKRRCSGLCRYVLDQALDTRRSIHEYRIECMHPRRVNQSVVLSIAPLRDGRDRQVGAVMIIRDVTRISLLEKELQERNQCHSLIGASPRMQEVYDIIDDLKDIDTTVLVTGPSGTGKELVARAIHFGGTRAAHPFVVVNCSALAENLLESELFGHVRGAFTGAVRDKVGRFEAANQGTIFLDEIGDISPRVQLKLLRFLETREFERVGDSTPVRLDVQVVTATNLDLREQIARGRFREDLYYRLKVVEIRMPSLKERSEDIPLLVSHYIRVFNERFNRQVIGVSKDAEKLLMEYRWPGNIRELIHALEHAFVVCKSPVIGLVDLPPEVRESSVAAGGRADTTAAGKDRVLEALRQTGGNKAKAARLLSVSRQTIYRMLQR